MDKEKIRKKNYTWFIGIDVSKHTLDYAIMRHHELVFHEKRKNEPSDIIDFISRLKELPKFTISRSIFCLESSGIYGNHLLNCLKTVKANIVVENPLIIKNFLGMTRGKTDKDDAERIAAYAQKNHNDLILWVARRPLINELARLFTLRNRLLGLSVALKTPLKEQRSYVKKNVQKQIVSLCKNSNKAIKEDMIKIDSHMDKLVNNDANLKVLMQRITSVPGVGRITALQMVISTNEFIDISEPKKFACYAGIAPFKQESGLMAKRGRVSHFANKKMKSLLHLCALKAVTIDEELKDYFERKVNVEKKPKLSAINAVRNKLILRVFACVKQERLFVKSSEMPNELVNDISIEISQNA
jgi:transposase